MHFLRLFRFCYWLKNLLVFVPAIVAGQSDWIYQDTEYHLLLTFLSFSLVTSAGYIFNDLADFERDRRHAYYRNKRPVAAGDIDKQTASFWLAVSLLGGLYIAHKWLINEVLWWEIAYFGLAVIYSLFLKKIPVLGLALMSFGAAFRVLAGAAAIEIPVPLWLLVAAGMLNWGINLLLARRAKGR